MRVLHVIPSVAPRYGGPSASIVSMCRALDGCGVQTTLVATDADGDARLDVPTDAPTMWEGVEARFFRRQFSESFKYSKPMARWLDRHAADFAVVHVHAVLSHGPLAAARAASRHGVPYVVRPLGTLDPWSLAQKPGRKRLLLRIAATGLLRSASAIHYTSTEEQRSVEHALSLSRGIVIPLGVEPALLSQPRRRDAERAQERYVLALSRLHPVKNLEALIDAFAETTSTSSSPEWKLVIAGDGDPRYAAGLRAHADKRRVAPFVSFAGWVDGDAKRELVRGASVYALPSLHENFGMSLVEAMAAGVPALVGRGVHLAADIEEAGAGWVVAPDAHAIASALRAAMTDAGERGRKSDAAVRLASRFAWPHVAGRLVELYAKLSRNSAGASAHVTAMRAGAIGP